MEFNTVVNDIVFKAGSKNFDKEFVRVSIMSQFGGSCFLQPFILENEEALKYSLTKIRDIYPNLCEIDGFCEDDSFFKLNNNIKKGIPVCLYHLEGLFEKLMKDDGISLESARRNCFMGINMARDGLFLKNNAKFCLFMTEEEYLVFISSACDDFASYCNRVIDFNKYFENKDGSSLSEFYCQKREGKIFKKI